MSRRNRPQAKAQRRVTRDKSFVQPGQDELGLFDPQPMRLPDPGPGSYDKYLKAYADEVWVYACVSRRAADVASTPMVLVDRKSGKKVEEHDFLKLLNNPNPQMQMTRKGFIWWLEASVLLAGNGYYLKDQLKAGRPSVLWPLIPSMIEVVPSKDPKIFRLGYKYNVGGKEIPLGADVCHQIMLPSPFDYNYGLPPLSAARMSADTHRASSRYNLRFFDNSARPDLIFKTPHSLTPEQRKRMAMVWMKRHRGEDKAHLPAFLEKGTEAQLIGLNQKDMDFILQKKMAREEVCSAYQTPPALVGLFEYANYANAAEQEAIYWRSTVVPDAKAICEFLTTTLLPIFDKSGMLELRVDESAIKALQEDQTKQAEYVERFWKMGVPLNQLVKSYKLPFGEVKTLGDISFINGAATKVDGTPVNAPAPALPGPIEPVKAAKATKLVQPTAAQLKAKHLAMLDRAEALGHPIKEAIRDQFDRQRDSVMAAVAGMAAGEKPSHAALKIDTVGSTKALAEAMAPHVKMSVHAGVMLEGRLLRDLTKVAPAATSTKAQARIDKWSAVHAFKWAGEMNDATMRRVDKIIEQHLADGDSVSDLSAALAEAFDTERDYRTDRAAQTEVIASLNEGALESYRENPQVEGKGWLSTEDEVTRPDHKQAGEIYNEKNPIPVDEPFQVGDAKGQAPGQTGDPSQDINCRCTILPIVRVEE